MSRYRDDCATSLLDGPGGAAGHDGIEITRQWFQGGTKQAKRRLPIGIFPPEPMPTERQLRTLATLDPWRLVDRVRAGDFSPGLMARAAEAVGQIADSTIAVPTLLLLLEAKELVVQEASIYGLSRHPTEEVVAALRVMAESDSTHRLVREIAAEVLEEISGS